MWRDVGGLGGRLKQMLRPGQHGDEASTPTSRKAALQAEAAQLKGVLEEMTNGIDSASVDGTWVQRFVELHQRYIEVGCHLGDSRAAPRRARAAAGETRSPPAGAPRGRPSPYLASSQ
ncbi:unnamed protein product [Prorocentrum cordatum]|uniref:Uncharacterized protein n=1 Tax=Prorocentrum cordatum TaxID=2364126 RepID=A0ABN9VDB0_9DINO|nr:unnamed protein product [Polarella glacialis]